MLIATSNPGLRGQNRKPTRVVGTVYRNTRPYPIFVSITVIGITGADSITLFIDTFTTPTSTRALMNIQHIGQYGSVYGIIMPGEYYLVTSTGSVVLSVWNEVKNDAL